MGQTEKNFDGKFTYKEYLTWSEEEQWELINGVPYNMTPAPSTQHQKIVTTLIALFYNALKDSPCQVFGTPFDVRLPEKENNSEDIEIFTVVQPDLAIICDRNKLDSRGCLGAPDLIIEVTSSSTLRKDIKEKFHLYEKAGVNQYWMIYPEQKTVVAFGLDIEGRYGRPDVYCETDIIPAKTYKPVSIDLSEIFKEF